MKKIIEKHPLAIRWLHWINFPLLAIMIWSGLMIYWAYDPYFFGWGNFVIFKFFPEWFYKFLHLKYRLAEGMGIHFTFMWLFFANGMIYVLYLIFSKEWRHIFPNKHSFKEGWQQLLFDLHLRKEEPVASKYNGAQKIAYTGTVLLGFLAILSGLAIYKPIQLIWLTNLFGGYESARVVHFVVMLLFLVFFAIHVFQVIRAGWNNFRSMVAGFEIAKKSSKTNADEREE